MELKTVNDYEFEVKLVKKFNLNDYKKTKKCVECLKPVLKTLADKKLANFDFGWLTRFELSIFAAEIFDELVPLLVVLKKFASTDAANWSLRAVLCRKMVNLKASLGLLSPEETLTFSI